MADQRFQSSDSNRGANTLRFAKTCALPSALKLERGGELAKVDVAYETYGTLNADKSNAILICHALSGDSHVARHEPDDDPGWWDAVVGPGKPIDTDRFLVVCPNVLGGCRGTTGPTSIDPASGQPYGQTFPVITVSDIVNVQRQFLDQLGIVRPLAVIGGSLGGHMALLWATQVPNPPLGVIPIATSPRLTSQALAFDVVGRNAIRTDPENGLAIARMLGHITYLSREAMMRKFDPHRLEPRQIATEFETRFTVGSYLAHQGDKFVERFDKDSYVTLSTAMDLFDLGADHETLAQKLAMSQCRWLILSFSSDWLFPPFQSRQLVDALISTDKSVSYCNVTSACGHDAFLLPDDLPVYGEMIRAFLEERMKDEGGRMNAEENRDGYGFSPSSSLASPSSIFHEQRLDYDTIVELIPSDASVLDLGCGSGELLARLRQRGQHRRLMGVELDERQILSSLRLGLDVVHADLNKGLDAFADNQFDVVVLSQTLQAVTAVDRVLADMLRVGRMGIVSFPNLAYHKLRSMLADEGRAPRAGAWLGYSWHQTPNLRFLSIADFEDFCAKRSIRIVRQVALNTEEQRQILEDPNRLADVAVVVISR